MFCLCRDHGSVRSIWRNALQTFLSTEHSKDELQLWLRRAFLGNGLDRFVQFWWLTEPVSKILENHTEMAGKGPMESAALVLERAPGYSGTGFLLKTALRDLARLLPQRPADYSSWSPVGPGARRALDIIMGDLLPDPNRHHSSESYVCDVYRDALAGSSAIENACAGFCFGFMHLCSISEHRSYNMFGCCG